MSYRFANQNKDTIDIIVNFKPFESYTIDEIKKIAEMIEGNKIIIISESNRAEFIKIIKEAIKKSISKELNNLIPEISFLEISIINDPININNTNILIKLPESHFNRESLKKALLAIWRKLQVFEVSINYSKDSIPLMIENKIFSTPIILGKNGLSKNIHFDPENIEQNNIKYCDQISSIILTETLNQTLDRIIKRTTDTITNYIDKLNSKSFRFSFFARIFGNGKEISRARFYKKTLSCDVELKEKILIIYSLLATLPENFLQNEVAESILGVGNKDIKIARARVKLWVKLLCNVEGMSTTDRDLLNNAIGKFVFEAENSYKAPIIQDVIFNKEIVVTRSRRHSV